MARVTNMCNQSYHRYPFTGERLNKLISILIRQIKRVCKLKKTDATEIDLMAVTGFLSSLIVMCGAAVFSRYEGWSYMDSFYYCFVTLTTIGFGDFVALQVTTLRERRINLESNLIEQFVLERSSSHQPAGLRGFLNRLYSVRTGCGGR